MVSMVLLLVVAARAMRPALTAPLPVDDHACGDRLQDFRDALYYPIRELLSGGNPYRPSAMFSDWPVCQAFNLYNPFHLLIHLPFAVVDYRIGVVAFSVLNIFLLVALSYLAVKQLRDYLGHEVVPLIAGTAIVSALLLASQVGKAQVYVGQVNPLIALGAAGALAMRQKSPVLASIAFAFAWLKPQFGIPLLILLWARGSRRVALAGTGIACLAGLPVVGLLVMRDGFGAFVEAIRSNLSYANHAGYLAVDSLTAYRVDVPAVVFRATGYLLPAGEIVAFIGVITITALVVRRLDKEASTDSRAVADLLMMVGVVIAVVHEPGDVLLAVPALAVCAAVSWRRRDWLVGTAVLAITVPFAHLYSIDQVLIHLGGQRISSTLDGAAIILGWLFLIAASLRSRAQIEPSNRIDVVEAVSPGRP